MRYLIFPSNRASRVSWNFWFKTVGANYQKGLTLYMLLDIHIPEFSPEGVENHSWINSPEQETRFPVHLTGLQARLSSRHIFLRSNLIDG